MTTIAKCKCSALRDLVPFVQFKKRKKKHGGVLILVKVLNRATHHKYRQPKFFKNISNVF